MIQTLQLILSISFLVVIHELGHFLFARLFGVRVEKFYMFFNPRYSLVRCKKFDGRWHFEFFSRNTDADHPWSQHPESTEWGLGWLPFGGYCAICGMVDETHDAESLAQSEPQPYEFRAHPAWQRMFIILGGILVNFIAAMLIFMALMYRNGTSELPLDHIDRGLYYSDLMLDEGFRQQDRILLVDGVAPHTLADAVQAIIIDGHRDVTVARGEDTLVLRMSEDLGNRYLSTQSAFDRAERERSRADKSYERQRYILMAPYFPLVVDSVLPGSASADAGLRRGDSIVAVGGREALSYHEVANQLRLHACDSTVISFYREGTLCSLPIYLSDRCKLGVTYRPLSCFFSPVVHEYSLLESVSAGWNYGVNYLSMYVRQFRLIFSKEGAQSVGGFGAIGQMFPTAWDWTSFWHMTAIISLILAFMNFLPIPALDGGYILFLIWEMVTRRKPSDRFLERANEVGFWLLLALMIFANANDLLKFFF